MGKDLVKIPSKTSADTYNIVLGQDYRIYCTCKGWKFSKPPIKECKHLKELFGGNRESVMVELLKPNVVDSLDKASIRKVIL